MKIVLAIDSFKGCLTSEEVEQAVAQSLSAKFANSLIDSIPIADGGEGTLSTLMQHTQAIYQTVEVHNPCMKKIRASYGISSDGRKAFIEMASASGLPLISESERNPMKTTTFGTGELIADALDKGCTEFIIGIGGSATNDAGTGMLQALGYRFMDKGGKALGVGGEILSKISFIDESAKHPLLKNAHFIVACDVSNPFNGPQGAAHIFAPQKGANGTMVDELDYGLQQFAQAIRRHTGKDISSIPGSGAAGGMGGGMLAFLPSVLKSGSEIILELCNFNERIEGANLIITGEGKMDKQTLMGKIPYHILQAGLKKGIPVIALTGKAEDKEELINAGFKGIYTITPDSMPLAEAMKPEVAQKNIQRLLGSSTPADLESLIR